VKLITCPTLKITTTLKKILFWAAGSPPKKILKKKQKNILGSGKRWKSTMVKFKSANCFVDRGQLTTVNWVGGDAHAPDALGHPPLRTNAPRVRGITSRDSIHERASRSVFASNDHKLGIVCVIGDYSQGERKRQKRERVRHVREEGFDSSLADRESCRSKEGCCQAADGAAIQIIRE
jgi:hypothetical protein